MERRRKFCRQHPQREPAMVALLGHYLYEVGAAPAEALRDAKLQMSIAFNEGRDEPPQ